MLLKRVCTSEENISHTPWSFWTGAFFIVKMRSKLEVKINIQNNQNFNAIFDEMRLSNDREFFNT